MLILVLEYLLTFFLVGWVLISLVDRSLRAKAYKGPMSDHFNGEVFLNIKAGNEYVFTRSYGRLFHWLLTREKNVWEKRPVAPTKPTARVDGSEIVATFINHATVLIQTEGVNILTDPIYSKRASPFSFMGPARYTLPGVSFDDLPKIDVVVISHNHYDHLDIATLKRLVKRDSPRILVPLGNKSFMTSSGVEGVEELDWWNSHQHSASFKIMCVPAQHFSSRAFSDRNKTLWSGYVVTTPHGNIYFAGDTGNGPFVERIAERFPEGFRLGLLPIGAFRPEWVMQEVHISPTEAFDIQKRLNITDALGIHHSTFKLADDKQDEPVEHIQRLAKDIETGKAFHTLKNGESLHLGLE